MILLKDGFYLEANGNASELYLMKLSVDGDEPVLVSVFSNLSDAINGAKNALAIDRMMSGGDISLAEAEKLDTKAYYDIESLREDENPFWKM